MRRIILAAVAAVLLATALPASADVDIDVPVYVGGVNLLTPDPGSSSASAICYKKERTGTNPPQPQESNICVYRDLDKTWGSVDFSAPAWGYGEDVYFDLYVQRCRVSDGYCVKIASIYEHRISNQYGYAFVQTTKVSQSADGRVYRACASMSSSVDFGYRTTCTGKLS